jgi:hypothetical protein
MKKVSPASSGTQRVYEAIGARLGVEMSSMFGMPTLKLGGKAFAGLFGDAMVFKLEGGAHAEALALRGAEPFDPSGMGRAMKAWVVVPAAHDKRWDALAHHALAAMGAAVKPVKSATKPRPTVKKSGKRRGA